MPARERRPRRRTKPLEREPLSSAGLIQLAHVAEPEHWDAGLRRDLVRALIDRGCKEAVAARMAATFEARTKFQPRFIGDPEALKAELHALYEAGA